MSKENIHYLGHLVKYLICNSEIESLNEGTIMLGSSKKFGWVVLKSGYNLNPYCDLKNILYDLNNDHSNKNTDWLSIDGKGH